MTYSTPDLDTISLTTNAAIRSGMGRDPALPRSVLGVLGKAFSGASDGLYDAIDQAAKDIIYTSASDDAIIRWAAIWGETLKAPAPASATVHVVGGIGLLPSGSIVARADGIEYAFDLDVTLVDGSALGKITCTSAGSMTTLNDGAVLTVVQPTEGVSSTVTVTASDLTPGTDMETAQELLTRLLARIRQTPQGGSVSDYQGWATAVAGVTRAWAVGGWNGPGTVGVLFMCDDRTNPIPLAGDVDNVQAAIDAERPVAARSFAVAPTPSPLNLSIKLNPDASVLRTAVQGELANLVTTECLPTGFTLPLSHIRAAISAAIGTGDYTMPAPAADVTTPAGTITTMGAITWLT